MTKLILLEILGTNHEAMSFHDRATFIGDLLEDLVHYKSDY